MSDKASFRKCSGSESVSASIAAEAQRYVRDAAGPIRAGESVKAQLRRSAANLSPCPHWRIRAAWYGEAGCWSATALEDLRARWSAWKSRQEAKQEAKLHAETALLRAQIAALKAQLVPSDEDLFSPEIDRLEWRLRCLSDQDSAEPIE